MKNTEKDVAARVDISEDISQIRRILTRLLGEVQGSGSDDIKNKLLRNIDELDLLDKDVMHKAVGRRYPLLDPHKSATHSMRKERGKFNSQLTQRIKVIYEASKKISKGYIEGALDEPDQELAALHHHIVEARNFYEDRDSILRGV